MKIDSAFQTWFEGQHGKREKDTAMTDQILRDQAMAGTKAQTELLRRSEWDARYQSALYAWQAAGGDTIVSFVPEKTIEKVNLGFVADRSGVVFTELLDSVLSEDDPAEAGTIVEAKDGAVAEYGDTKESPASSYTDPATGMIFETKYLGAFPTTKIFTIDDVTLSSNDGWVFRHDSPDPEGIWMPFNDPNLKVQIATAGGYIFFSYVGFAWWGYDPVAGMKDGALILAARRADRAEKDDDEPEYQPEKCPECGQMTVVEKPSGIACTDPKCGYWFCA